MPEGDDFELMQGGELPRRGLVPVTPPRGRGPAAWGEPLSRQGLLDQPSSQNVGRSTDLTLQTGVTSSSNILNLQGPDETARAMTVSIMKDVLTAGVIADLFARIQWGSGGVQYEVDVDLVRGAVFQLSCSFLRVNVRGSGTGRYRFSAHVGYNAAGDKSARRTITYGAIGVGVSSTARSIPNFARDVQILRTPTTANLTLRFEQGGAVVAEHNVGNGPGDAAEIIRVPHIASEVVIVNGMGAALAQCYAVYGLCL